jgi:hypothetical protein
VSNKNLAEWGKLMRTMLEMRFSYLYTGERFAIGGFIVASFALHYAYPHLQLYNLASFWIAFLLLQFLLLQGSAYWYAKWKRLKQENKSITPVAMVRQLKKAQKMNIVLIAIAPFLFGMDVWRWGSNLPVDGLLLAGGIYLFAILEYINYFHVQLSYDNGADLRYLWKTKRFKRASLRKDFERLL